MFSLCCKKENKKRGQNIPSLKMNDKLSGYSAYLK